MVSLKKSLSSGEYPDSFTESGIKSRNEENSAIPLHAHAVLHALPTNFASKPTVVMVASYTLNRLDTSANGIYAVKKPSCRHRTLALCAQVLWLPLGLLYRVDPISVSNLYIGTGLISMYHTDMLVLRCCLHTQYKYTHKIHIAIILKGIEDLVG